MISLLLHPSERTLKEFADAAIAPGRRRRTSSHLARCVACREKVTFIRLVKAEAQNLPSPRARDELLERIHARLQAGDEVILPVADPIAPRRLLRLVAAAAAIALLVLAIRLVGRAPRLEAGATQGELRFAPAGPTPGQRVSVEYRSAANLSQEERLVLRARYRTPRDEAYNSGMRQVAAVELTREGDVFRGSITLPDSVVYAVFAVEDLEGHRVDDNGRKLWELLVSDTTGRPEFDALEQRENDLMGRNWQLAYETARRATTLYPQRIETWLTLLFFEKAVLGEAGSDSLLREHRARFHQFDGQLANTRHLPADQLGWMFWYAVYVGDTARQAYWRGRLSHEAPTSPLAVQNRAIDIGNEYRDAPLNALAALDRLWQQVGPAHKYLVNIGFSIAQRAGTPEAIARWAARDLLMIPGDQTWVASVLTRYAPLREDGMRRLRGQLAILKARHDTWRPLDRSVDEQLLANQTQMRGIFASLGDALVASGQVHPGLDTLSLATRDGWDTDLFKRVAAVKLLAGDTVGAGRLFALVAADPAASESYADSARRMLGESVSVTEWERQIGDARQEMRTRVLAQVTEKTLPSGVRVSGNDGNALDLHSLAAGHVTLVVFWSRFCGPALEDLPGLQQLSARLAGFGARIVTITDDKPSAEGQAFLSRKGLTFPVYYDAWREASRAFNQWGTPQYFVLDESANVRFQYTSLDRALAEAVSLLPEQPRGGKPGN